MATGNLDPAHVTRFIVSGLHADHYGPSRSRYIHVAIHPDVEDMRSAANRYDVHRSGRAQDQSEAVGLFQATPFRSRYDRKAKVWVDSTSACAGVMRLVQGWCSREVIAHECTHAALHITRLDDWGKPDHEGIANFGDGCDDTEESFAYLLGAMVQTVEVMVDEAHQRMGITRA